MPIPFRLPRCLTIAMGCLCVFILCVVLPTFAASAGELEVALGEVDVTPDVAGRVVWIAGYGHGRRATGVHDPLFARVVLLKDGQKKIALVSVDVVGLPYPVVQKIRRELDDYAYVMVSATHSHEGPDTIGIWGRTVFTSGVNPQYIQLLIDRVVKCVRAAELNFTPATAEYGTAEDESLLGDSRLPQVRDGHLRLLRFRNAKDGTLLGLLVQWNCHPEALGSRNTLITADFPAATVEYIHAKYEVPVAYFTGTVGGLMAPPDGVIRDEQGKLLEEGQFDYAREYGRAVGSLADQAVGNARPIKLTPLVVSARPIAVPLVNPYYHLARSLGVIRREGRIWTGKAEVLGRMLTPHNARGEQFAVETEVAYLRLGQLHVACIPGEIYPELVYGKIQNPVDPGADYPDAPRERHVTDILPGERFLLFGLANDELGYIIPKRQWDQKPPYAYGRTRAQYGEINSVGPDIAPIVMKALENRVRETVK